jgi:hypothetical protein
VSGINAERPIIAASRRVRTASPSLRKSPILKPSANLAQGYEVYKFSTADGREYLGFVVGERADATIIRQTDGVQVELKKADIDR